MKKINIKMLAAALLAAGVMASGIAVGSYAGADVATAAEFTVEEKKAVLYTNGNTKLYEKPDINSTVVTTIAGGLPIDVTGITSNGWFRVNLEGTYYIPGYGLVESAVAGMSNITSSDLKQLTKGTFSFYKNPQLSDFDADDIEDMDENTYIKYMDSFLMGYAIIDNCILRDTGETLKTVYTRESKNDASVAALTMQAYLINYRNKYFSDSMTGPFRSEKDLKLALNRAIRYDIKNFGSVYRNASIGSNEDKMKDFMEDVIDDMKAEQGVSFTCKMEYGTYKESDGSESKGWIISFTKKD